MCSTLTVTTSTGRVLQFPGLNAVVDEHGAVWIGDDAAVVADANGDDSEWECWFAPGAVEYTRFLDEG